MWLLIDFHLFINFKWKKITKYLGSSICKLLKTYILLFFLS